MAFLDARTRKISVPELPRDALLVDVAKSRAGFQHELAHAVFSPRDPELEAWWERVCIAAEESSLSNLDVLVPAFQMLEDLRIERRAGRDWSQVDREWLRFNALARATVPSILAHARQTGWTPTATGLAGRQIAGSLEEQVTTEFVQLGPEARAAVDVATPFWERYCDIEEIDRSAPVDSIVKFAHIPDVAKATSLLPKDDD